MIIGYQGIPGSYSEEALITNLQGHEHKACPTFTDLIKACEDETVEAVLLPIENTIGGSIKRAYALMVDALLYINGEINHPIHHCLLAHPRTRREKLKHVMSHPEALLQCRHYIEKNGWSSKEFRDTAESAKIVAQKKMITTAAIASQRCSVLYDLQIVERNIEDVLTNTTRFFLLERKPGVREAHKITITFRLSHKPGSLCAILQTIAEAGYNLTKIESCPIPEEPYHYEFVADIEVLNKKWNELLEKLQEKIGKVRLMGAYPVIKLGEF